jgi:hypothetical protein
MNSRRNGKQSIHGFFGLQLCRCLSTQADRQTGAPLDYPTP